MKDFGTIPRRNVLAVAGVGLAAGLLAGAGARAETQTPALALDPAGGVDPATSWLDGKLYALWKDPGAGGELEYAVFDGSAWSLQQQIPGANSDVPPSLVTFGARLYAAWKGKAADQRIWYSVFDGSHWSHQAQIPGAVTLGAPALSVSGTTLYAVWKGAGAELSSTAFDGAKWSKPDSPAGTPVAAGTHPFTPQMIAATALTGVDQGSHGDCMFEAALVATAMTPRGQAALSKAIVQNADASFTVTFAGDPHHPVQVTENQLITTHVHDDAKWSRILEAALISSSSFANGAHIPDDAPKDKSEAGSPGIFALYLLTGGPATNHPTASPTIGAEIVRALGNGQPVIAFCSNNDGGALVSGHEWTVTSCDPQQNRITLRNPWGNFKTAGTSRGGIQYDGAAEVSMTLQQFPQFYRNSTFGYEKA
jgi:hypothetical protein